MSFLNIALPLADKGFRVFPLVPREKFPVRLVEGDHFDAATIDPEQIKLWAEQEPNANVGLSPDEHFCFLETDDEASLHDRCADLPPEVWNTMRASARENRCYYVFRQTMRTRKVGNMIVEQGADRPNLFEFKQHRLYVVGPGSIHPKTGTPYQVEWREIPAMPDVLLNRLCELSGAPKVAEAHVMSEEAKREAALLDSFLEYYEVAALGPWFTKGKQWYRPIVCPWESAHENRNQGSSTCIVYTEGGGYGFDCKHRCANKTWQEFRGELESRFPSKPRFAFRNSGPTVRVGSAIFLGGSQTLTHVSDWRQHYHTLEEISNVKPPEFLIEGFLQVQAICGIAAPVGQRKSLIALNVVHALCTGEPLFDHFKVPKTISRALYICPEMGLISFADRVKRIGLLPYVGKSFFCRTMSSEGFLPLSEMGPEEIADAVIVLDTAARFLQGDENSAEHTRLFAEQVFQLIKGQALAVIILHHSQKGSAKAEELTLENSMRGSGELGAFLTSCWTTRQENDPDLDYYGSSLLKNVKQRDFLSKSFKVTSDPNCRLHFVPDSEGAKLSRKTTADRDGRDAEALQVIRDNPQMPQAKLVLRLKTLGIKRSKSWVGNKKVELGMGGISVQIDHAP